MQLESRLPACLPVSSTTSTRATITSLPSVVIDGLLCSTPIKPSASSKTSWKRCGVGMSSTSTAYVVMPEHVHLLVSEPREKPLLFGDTDVETSRIARTAASLQRITFLAAALLRLQCLYRHEMDGENALSASQSGDARAGRRSGRLDVEQLSTLVNRRGNAGRDRVEVDVRQA